MMTKNLNLAAVGLLLAACTGVPPAPLPPAAPIREAEFPGARAILQGFTAPTQREEWRAGESILYALRLEHGVDCERWLVRLSVADAEVAFARDDALTLGVSIGDEGSVTLMSAYRRYAVAVFQADGTPLGESLVKVPYDFLRFSFLDACAALKRRPLRDADKTNVAGAHAALISFLSILQEDPVLSPILWRVVDRPSVLSVIASFGASLGIAADLESAVPEPTPGVSGWNRDAVRFPLTLTINGGRALDARILATDPLVPLRMGGGIVSVEATRPSNPAVRFTAQVLAAASP